MSTLVTTILIGFGFFVLALALLGISWIITGKLMIKPGACGRAPKQKRDKNCGKDVKCTLCEHEKDDDVQ